MLGFVSNVLCNTDHRMFFRIAKAASNLVFAAADV